MRKHILIAEDEPECRRLVSLSLQRSGFRVTAIQEGMEFIKAMQNGYQPDAVILSWELPFGEGEALLDWLQYQGIVDIRIIVLRARLVGDNDRWESALPEVTWLERPFQMHDLLVRLFRSDFHQERKQIQYIVGKSSWTMNQ